MFFQCTEIFRAKRIPGFYACVATNFVAYGPSSYTSGNSALKRRSVDDVAIYEIGNISLLFWNTCSNQRALTKWYSLLTHSQNSSCVAHRAAACRAFITTPNPGGFGNQWVPVPSGYTQLVVANVTGCATISITSLYNVAYYNYGTIYGRYNLSLPFYNGEFKFSFFLIKNFLAFFF